MNDQYFFTSLARRIPALLLAGLFFFISVGFAHACVDDHNESDKTEHVISCKCACHHHLQIPESEPVLIDYELSDSEDSIFPQYRLPDAEPTGIFRPPKHLV